MKLVLTRDSVSAGDDCDAPHRSELVLPDGSSVEQAVSCIANAGYLARIGTGEATWSVVSRRPIAVIAQQWPSPSMLSSVPYRLKDLSYDGNMLRVHVNYHAQQDPKVVFEVLARLNRAAF